MMVDARNLTAHAYIEDIAEKIYARLPVHLQLLQKCVSPNPV